MTDREVYIEKYGGPEVLQIREAEPRLPGPGQARIRHHAIGLNYIDVYFRTGLYPAPLPLRLGKEAAGTVEALGSGVTGLSVGDRVGYGFGELGAYADSNCVAANRLIKLRDGISFDLAAATMLKGLTAHYLLRSVHRVAAGESILFYAAAGGVGNIACQWARNLGANVIGVVGSQEKVVAAQANGCAHVLVAGNDDIIACVRDLTGGTGVSVVYDSLGAETFEQSLKCLARRGLMVSYGNATGAVTGISLGALATNGSLTVTRPVLGDFIADDSDFEIASRELMQELDGKINVTIGRTFTLAEIAKAHEALESRNTVGPTVIIPT